MGPRKIVKRISPPWTKSLQNLTAKILLNFYFKLKKIKFRKCFKKNLCI